jgi:hypothetical protein
MGNREESMRSALADISMNLETDGVPMVQSIPFSETSDGYRPSEFIEREVSRFLSRFSLAFLREDRCIEYFVSRRRDRRPISRALVLSHAAFTNRIHVSRFYPELVREADSKYLSAACFFLVIQHFGQVLHLDRRSAIDLETREEVYERFYARLPEFPFRIRRRFPGENCEILCPYAPLCFDTAVIEPLRGEETKRAFLFE